MRIRMYGGVRGRKTKVGGKPTFVFLLLDYCSRTRNVLRCRSVHEKGVFCGRANQNQKKG